MINILKNIEEIRKEKGLKQAVVGSILGVSQSAYSNYITRNSDIYYNRLSQIADALGVRVIDIITYPKKYVDPDTILENALSFEEKVTLQIELKKEKKEQVLKLVFGENNLEILNK
ncbi:helix-turn-helix transcriptional regulator [Dysgonomonas sp. GY75]|uniref:helix-turn-helix domain-containing protein n=1 Tax=Dysgonomonas sp. GY75 TaxID=2780419 RepID=UPI001883E621|nr:helix-turn-helix transcriptional regulator [Dysgonomonas sp. GY75]MBF0649164.1 helix-turn-helix transcriptional regulator [Dysgonomonas sp. GY75]